MNAFKRFGIERLSPSSLNCWMETPGLWSLRYLGGVRDESGPAANRGLAVERGMECLLRGYPLADATDRAIAEFGNLNFGELSAEIEEEAARIPGMVSQCLLWAGTGPFHATIGTLAATQLKVETWLDGVSVPVIGYVDFTFMDGPDLDLKTTKACPSKPKPAHLRQIALYAKARDKAAALLYVTDKKFAYYQPSPAELAGALRELAGAARSLERFLGIMPDAETAICTLPHPVDHYAYGAAAKSLLDEMES